MTTRKIRHITQTLSHALNHAHARKSLKRFATVPRTSFHAPKTGRSNQF